MDVVIISPEPGRQVEIGKQLLALADNPYQVQWVTYPQAGFQIPLELFVKFDAFDGDGQLQVEQEAVALPRRRRRSKESTDNNTSEEE